MPELHHLIPSSSSRGFAALPDLFGAYGGAVRVCESSSAEYPRLWLAVDELDDLNGPPDGPRHTATIHLEAEDAWRLADQLRAMVRGHYQGDCTPDWVAEAEEPSDG